LHAVNGDVVDLGVRKPSAVITMQLVIGKNGAKTDGCPVILIGKSSGDMNRLGSTVVSALLPLLEQVVVMFKVFHDV
jgi:hypothetical protein